MPEDDELRKTVRCTRF